MHIPDTAPREPLSRLEIDLAALHHNVEALRSIVGEHTALCGTVKKNAYGLGAVPIAHRMAKAGCDMIAVYSPDEAEQLIHGAITSPLLLLYPLRHLGRTDPLYRPAVAERLHLTIHDPPQLDQLDAIGRTFGMRLPIHLFLDTGMSRSGLSPEQFAQALATQADRKYLRLAGVMSHFATADTDPDFMKQQAQRFETALAEHADAIPSDALIHLANTYATLRGNPLHHTMIRAGLGLYGYGTDDLAPGNTLAPLPTLKPIVRWVSRIIHTQRYTKGSAVGYGATHKLRKASTLAIVPVGYGDGYPMGLSNKAIVRVKHNEQWHDCPVRGRVNMDQLTIDTTALIKPAAFQPESLHGCEVEIYSNDPQAPNALPNLARQAQTHVYELLCRLNPQLIRAFKQ